jgi:diguanylate cyclase (GGDEF)-like protein
MGTEELITQARLLLIDDASAFRQLASTILRKIGFREVRQADSLSSALAILEKDTVGFDLILLDVHLPDGDGTEACGYFSRYAHTHGVPIVIITGDSAPEMIERAFAAEARDFITKPFNASVLRARLGGVLRHQAMLARLHRQEQHLARLFEVFSEGLLEVTCDMQIQRANRRAHILLGAPTGELYGLFLETALSSSRCDGEAMQHFMEKLRSSGSATCELDQDNLGRRLAVVANWIAEDDASDGALISLRDITSQHKQQMQLRHTALHDPLTGLPNRVLLLDRIGLAIARARRADRLLAVLFLDLDGFKAINDTLGHEAGDEALKTFATRIRQTLRRSDTAARLGGDEFVVVLEDIADAQSLAPQIQRLREAVCQPFVFKTQNWPLATSVGAALYPHDGENPSDLLQAADYNMYEDKRAKPR